MFGNATGGQLQKPINLAVSSDESVRRKPSWQQRLLDVADRSFAESLCWRTSQDLVGSMTAGAEHTNRPQDARERRWQRVHPIISGGLAWLIPGLGHAVQGRWFKAVLYATSILGLFLWGQILGEWSVVYYLRDNAGQTGLSFVAQLGVGLPAVPALIQSRRVNIAANRPLDAETLQRPGSQPDHLELDFRGRLVSQGPGRGDESQPAQGRIVLDLVPGQLRREYRGEFTGTVAGTATTIALGGWRPNVDRPIAAGWDRQVELEVVRSTEDHPELIRRLVGSSPRAFWNAYGVPPDTEKLQDLNGRLGKYYELALVFSWVAGLLNLLAFWDAILGPAYGFGDEHLANPNAEPANGKETSTPTAGQPPAATSANRPQPSNTTPVTGRST